MAKTKEVLGIIAIIAALSVNLLACGMMVGAVRQKVNTLEELSIQEKNIDKNQDEQIATIKQKMAFFEGQVTTKLDNIIKTQDRIVEFMSELEMAPPGK